MKPSAAVSMPADDVFTLRRGAAPLMVSIPHAGVVVPDELAALMSPQARMLADTDWHLPLVYDFLAAMDATILVATHSRLVVDLNRPPDNQNLYPGQNTTGLVPADTFRFEAIYPDGLPDEAEVTRRRELYWRPYHETLATELARLTQAHQKVVLWDAHSIASELPRFFEGRLTDLNFGTAQGAACDPQLIDAILAPVRAQDDYNWVLNGRFTGGYITRRYGNPAAAVHAVQLEMTQHLYMDEQAPFALLPERADSLKPLLQQCLQAALDWAEQ